MTEHANEATTTSRSATWRSDLLASVVVFLVAMPLCMGVAIASGAPVAAGIITGIIGGIVVGAFAGCPLQVSGPAAGLTVIVYEIVQKLGFETLGLVVLVAGALQLAAGLARLGQWFRAVSPAVIKGMLAGIGFLILAGQFHVMLDAKPPGSGAVNLQRIPDALWHSLSLPRLDSGPVRRAQVAALQTSRGLLQQQATLRQRLREAKTADQYQALAEQQQTLADRIANWSQSLADCVVDQESLDAAREAAALSLGVAQSLRATEVGDEAVKSSTDSVALQMDQASENLARAQAPLRHPELAFALGLLTIGVIVVWTEFAPRRLKVVPPALVAVIVTATVASLLALPVFYVEVPSSLWSDVHWPTLGALQSAPWKLVLQYGVLTAIVASAETLLCAAAVDQIQTGPRTNYDRELAAQGVGNLLCGLVNALPMTGVIVRSSANVQAGGKTRLSTILHGVWLLVFVSGMAALLRQIPTSCLAAILVYTGYKLIDVRAIRELRDFGWGEVAIYATTIAVIVFDDLLTGVIVGLLLSALKLLHTFAFLECHITPVDDEQKSVLRLRGAATFIRLPVLASELDRIPGGIELHVDFSELDYIDHACLELLMNWGARHQATGGRLVIDWESLQERYRRQRSAARSAN
ncbi:MAG: SulP family inorganic anion transporter [Pirellulales bacterium]